MTLLTLHGREVENVFDLLGQGEDGMTYSLGWALQQASPFLQRICARVGLRDSLENVSVHLQHSRSGFGRTDIEVVSPGEGMVVVEAKRGFVFPSEKQIRQYLKGVQADPVREAPFRHMVVLTAYPEEVAFQNPCAPTRVDGVPVSIQYLSWRTVVSLARDSIASATRPAARVLTDFVSYLQRCITMQDRESNMVYVVALSHDTFAGGHITFIDVVQTHNRYFHPVGNHYPTSPPNYIAFRYGGRLQSIHFVENVKVITQFAEHFPGTSNERVKPLFLYTLGPAIQPSHEVRSGPIRNMRCYCMLDTLLTCNTVQEALKETKRRLEEAA